MNRLAWSTIAIGACAEILLLAGAPRAQTQTPVPPQQQAPVFRVTTTLVPLTVTVIDKDGRPVPDLRQSDFQVFENGKPREVVAFFPQPMVAGEIKTGVESTVESTPADRSPWSSKVAPKTSRTFLFVLGLGRIQYPTKAIDGVLNFIRTKALPQDAIGVLAFNRATDFTTDHERIIQMLERFRREHERIVFNIKEFRIFNRLGLPQPASTQADIDAIFAGPPPGSPMRKAADLLLGIDGSVPVPELRGELTGQLGWDALPLQDLVSELNVLKLYAGVEYLRPMAGEKHLVFLGGELEIVSVEEATILARRASNAEVTLDIIRTLGTPPVFGAPDPFRELPKGGMGNLEKLNELQQFETTASLTGGVFTGVSMAEKALTRIDQRSRFSYLLGYEPVTTELDGKFRNVRVKVNRPGVTVLFRSGYFAADRPDAAEVNQAIASARVDTAFRFNQPSTDIGLDVRALLIRTSSPQEVAVDLTISASRLAFTPTADGRYSVSVVIGLYCRSARNEMIGMVKGGLNATLNEPTYREYLRNGIPYALKLPITGIPDTLKVIVSDAGSGLIGTASVRVRDK